MISDVKHVVLVLSGKGGVGKSTVAVQLALALTHGGNHKGKDSAVIWRGPKKNAMIRQFLTDVNWGELDYLIVDTPPGTSDEHISVVECLKEFRNPDGAVLVTTPQALSIGDVRREITFCRKGNINILGVVENMSGYVCPHC
ncbi:unnamed protein product, partial [Medioppia subpectinata]